MFAVLRWTIVASFVSALGAGAFAATVAAGDTSPPVDTAGEPKPRWKIIELDSRYIPRDTPFYWIDNERVLFSAFLLEKPIEDRIEFVKAFEKNSPRQLYLWDIQGRVTAIAQHAGDYCYGGGRVIWTVDSDEGFFIRDIWDFLTGKLPDFNTHLQALRVGGSIYGPRIFSGHGKVINGKLVEEGKESHRGVNSPKIRFDELTCKQVRRPFRISSPLWLPLRSEDGFIEVDVSRSKQMVWHRPGSKDGVLLPIHSRVDYMSPFTVQYYQHRGAYFIWHPSDFWSKDPYVQREDDCLFAWWFYPDGRTERVCIPFGPWSKGGEKSRGAYVLPLRDGLLIIHRRADEPDGPGGGYYLSHGTQWRVFENFTFYPRASYSMHTIENYPDFHLTRGTSVSPDGCKVVVAYAETYMDGKQCQNFGGSSKCKAMIIDFCAERK
ncbi:MAG: hypothetical protein FJX37_03650 [Alphaproteobacteria bacterium]|nr:hypothetical protein [Alphaproteobacteria bacterium]MBM3952270.1 hypothetical protein [Rhodospirillales bacterium]